MASAPEVKIREVVNALVISAGLAINVAQADVKSAAKSLAKQYTQASAREIEADIARHLRNKG